MHSKPDTLQPTIDGQFKQVRKSRRCNLKKESVDTVVLDEDSSNTVFVNQPYITLPKKTPAKTRTTPKTKSSLNKQSRLSFQPSPKQDVRNKPEECESVINNNNNKGKETPVIASENLDEIRATSDSYSATKTNNDDSVKTSTQNDVSVNAEVLDTKPAIKAVDVNSSSYPDFKEIAQGKKIQPKKSYSRSARMLASLDSLSPNRAHVQVTKPSSQKSVSVVKPNSYANMESNVSAKILSSPVKRKPQLDCDNLKTATEPTVPASPSKIAKRALNAPSGNEKVLSAKYNELPLPAKYQLLFDKFVGLETSIQMMFNRSERCEFDKVTNAVQSITSRHFSLQDLSKIVTIVPNAYTIKYEKKYTCMMTKTFIWVLCIRPNFETSKDVFSASDIIARKSEFIEKMFTLVHDYHFKFLHELNPNLKLEKDSIKRWHPKFNLESIPDVEQSTLPERPIAALPRQGLNELIMKTKEKATEKLESALAKIEAASFSPSPKSSSTKGADSGFENINNNCIAKQPVPLSVSEKLRMKIQAKEAVKLSEKLSMTEEEKQKRALQDKVPQVAKVVRVLFLADKRAAIPEDEVITKCRSGVRGCLSSDDSKYCLDVITKHCPEWMSAVVVQSKKYIKINKSFDFNAVLAKIQNS